MQTGLTNPEIRPGILQQFKTGITLAFGSSEAIELRTELKIPDGYKPYCAAVFGYKNDETVNIPDRKSNLITYIK